MISRIDLNIEVGESFGRWRGGDDEAALPFVSSASVACGFHAGDYNSMLRMAEIGRRHGVRIGAHPGYQDLIGFGYRTMDMTPKELQALLLYQMGALEGIMRSVGEQLHHVKPHGRIYVQAMTDPVVARAVVEAVGQFDDQLPIYVTAGTACEDEARKAGLRTVREFFADRPLRADGSLLVEWASYFDPSPENVVERVSMFLTTGTIPAVEGGVVAVGADSICLHSDNEAGALVVEAVRQALESAGVEPVAP